MVHYFAPQQVVQAIQNAAAAHPNNASKLSDMHRKHPASEQQALQTG
jgi:hypothetical protein